MYLCLKEQFLFHRNNVQTRNSEQLSADIKVNLINFQSIKFEYKSDVRMNLEKLNVQTT